MVLKNALVGGKCRNIVIENGRIAALTEPAAGDGIDCGGKRVIPGLIDIHTHGCVGLDTMDADFAPMCRYYAEHGTTSLLATTMTMPTEDLLRVCRAKTDFPGAQILGFHFEGPYISPKYKGAQNEKNIKVPSVEEFRRFERVRMMTLAPEMPGSMAFIRAVAPDCAISIGHTDCDYETACRAIDAGACCLTHTYNAMPPFLHRAPGPIGAGVEKGIYAQVIGDGFHVLTPTLLATWRTFGKERMVLISDSIRPAGLPDGEYESGGLRVFLRDGIAKLADGTIAGSTATLWDCVCHLTKIGIPFDDAVYMATAAPAALLGINKGRVEVGYDADLLIVGDDMTLETVIIAGNIFSSR